jgi:osmotically-inducible protein OsmY
MTWACLSVRRVFSYIAIAVLASGCYDPSRDVRRRVLEQLASDPTTTGLKLRVAVSTGVATVSGDVTGRAQEQQVVAIVRRTSGIQDVINDLQIDDEVIATRVRQALKSDPAVATVPVAIMSDDGIVTLRSDRTNADQRTRMVKIASGIDGVVSVVDDMK